MSYMAAFRVTFETIEDACLLRVGGQIDSSKAAEFRKHLRNARLEGHTSLVDLANVSFIDPPASARCWRRVRPGRTPVTRSSSFGRPASSVA
jgi:hypothetical protein